MVRLPKITAKGSGRVNKLLLISHSTRVQIKWQEGWEKAIFYSTGKKCFAVENKEKM